MNPYALRGSWPAASWRSSSTRRPRLVECRSTRAVTRSWSDLPAISPVPALSGRREPGLDLPHRCPQGGPRRADRFVDDRPLRVVVEDVGYAPVRIPALAGWRGCEVGPGDSSRNEPRGRAELRHQLACEAVQARLFQGAGVPGRQADTSRNSSRDREAIERRPAGESPFVRAAGRSRCRAASRPSSRTLATPLRPGRRRSRPARRQRRSVEGAHRGLEANGWRSRALSRSSAAATRLADRRDWRRCLWRAVPGVWLETRRLGIGGSSRFHLDGDRATGVTKRGLRLSVSSQRTRPGSGTAGLVSESPAPLKQDRIRAPRRSSVSSSPTELRRSVREVEDARPEPGSMANSASASPDSGPRWTVLALADRLAQGDDPAARARLPDGLAVPAPGPLGRTILRRWRQTGSRPAGPSDQIAPGQDRRGLARKVGPSAQRRRACVGPPARPVARRALTPAGAEHPAVAPTRVRAAPRWPGSRHWSGSRRAPPQKSSSLTRSGAGTHR